MKDRIRSELHQAMKKKDTLRASTLRMMIAEITNKEKEGGNPVDEQDIVKVFYSMIRKREDALSQFLKMKREDLAQNERGEIEIIQEFLPKQLTENEIRKEVRGVIAETGAEDMKSMGKVMGILMKKLSGRAQGGTISKIVKEELSR